jgi:EAL domain-containing protein (putative c-di-GMP-specific phosphodiesterase class I)
MDMNMTWFHDGPEQPAAETHDDFVWTATSEGGFLIRQPAQRIAKVTGVPEAESPAAMHRRWLRHGPARPADLGDRGCHVRPEIADLIAGIELDEFFLEYQPIVSLASGEVEAFEGLVRWRHPQRGVLEPTAFIDDAEHAGLLPLLTPKILADACAAAAAWTDGRGGGATIAVSLNLCASQLRDARLVARVATAIEAGGVAPERLWFEITENTGARLALAQPQLLHQLRRLGIKLALDDFGSGCASIGCLRSLPIDAVKIDKSLVQQATATRSGERVLAASTEIARALGIVAVAEGIEEPDHLACARSLGCELGQGFHFAPPVSRVGADRMAALPQGWQVVDSSMYSNPHAHPSGAFRKPADRLTMKETVYLPDAARH